MNNQANEAQVLVCVARRALDDSQAAQLRHLLTRNLDWDRLVALARANGLLPLLHKHLNSAGIDLAQNEAVVQLKDECRENSQSNLYLTSQLLTLVRLFRREDIPLLVFKGPVLSHLCYGDVSLRQAGDIDILIHAGDFQRAKTLLESLHYQMLPPLSQAQETSHLNFHCEISFMRDDYFSFIDLHWGLSPKSFVFRLPTDQVLERSRLVDFAGDEVVTFGNEDLVLYLCMHGAKHLWRQLEWIAALAELVQTLPINWDTLIERASQAHASRMLVLGMQLVRQFFAVELPASLIALIEANKRMCALAEQIGAQLFVIERERPESTETNFFNFQIMDRKRDALVSAARATFVPTLSDWESLNLPGAFHPLYYAIRPLRLSKVYCVALWRKLAG